MLGKFVETTGYTRKYAIHLLNSWGRTRVVRIDGQMVKLVVGRPRRAKRRTRPRRYDQEVLKASGGSGTCSTSCAASAW